MGAVETLSIETARRQFDVNIFGLEVLQKKSFQLAAKSLVKSSTCLPWRATLYSFGAWYHAKNMP